MWLGPDVLTMRGSWGDGAGEPFDLHVEPARLRDATAMGWSGTEWAEAADDALPATYVRVGQRGPTSEGGGGAYIDDPAILDQLRDLGYVR